MGKKEIPEWFLWTTTGGLAAAVLLLLLIYGSTASANKANYGMMQANAGMSMMNSGMMRMMAGSMMKNGIMSQGDFENFGKAYDAQKDYYGYMQSMMQDGEVTGDEAGRMMANGRKMQSMMGGMMAGYDGGG